MAKRARLTGERWVMSDEKRALDVLVAGSLIPLAAPIGGVALIASRILDGPAPFVYQERIGRNSEPFLVRKIRSMQPVEPCKELHRTDTEITPLGRVIRPFAVDEIPQLLNILNGTMSVVGPRALTQENIEGIEVSLSRPLYEEWLHVYNTSRPGGLSTYNISARSGIGSENESEKKAKMDIADFRNASLGHDLKLMQVAAKTGLFLISQKLKTE